MKESTQQSDNESMRKPVNEPVGKKKDFMNESMFEPMGGPRKKTVKRDTRQYYKRFFKRPMDIVLSLFAIVFLSPVLLILGFLIRVKLGSPVLFRQNRPGLNGKIFTMMKFRSMTDEKDETGSPLPDHLRLTPFGKLLRATSLDELPELINILKGDMSIVGPRPLLVQYLELYDEHQERRHEVRPGLTGLAQINGRNMITWEEKFDLDVEYVDHISFMGDLKIIFQTVKKVIIKEGVSSDGSLTAELFQGSHKKDQEISNKL